jgi:hypothetical protein
VDLAEAYLLNSASIVDAGSDVVLFSYEKSLILNRVGGIPPLATGARLTGELDIVVAGIDDVLLRYRRICMRDS